ncbi:MAG: VgrG-related protein [Dehalococcoidia bacterium]
MPPAQPLITQWLIKLNGQPAQPAMMADVKRIEVDSNLFMPDMCTIELNQALNWMAHDWIGRAVVIDAQDAPGEQGEHRSTTPEPIFAGEIVSVEGDFRENDHNFLVLRAYDRSHRLQHGSKARQWRQVTDSDIVKRIAQEHGLSPEVDGTSFVHTQIFQDNVSDFEFVTQRAKAAGRIFTVDDRKLVFKKPQSIQRPQVALDLGATMLEFHPRFTVGAQVSEVTVRGWDVKNKREVLGKATNGFSIATEGGSRKPGHRLYTAGVSAAGAQLVTDQVIDEQRQGDEAATAVLNGIWSGDFRGDGIAMGNPELQAGSKVEITNLDKFNGTYFVTSVRHVYDGGHYLTHFNISGMSADTTADLVSAREEVGRTSSGRVSHGLAVALVTDNRDPDKMGRVKLMFPWFNPDQQTEWVRMATPMAGGGRGFYYPPEVRDEVLVGFEHGDFNRPYVVGALWNGIDESPIPATEAVGSDGKVEKRVIKTRAGHIIRLDDKSGSEKIEIIDKTGKNKITIESSNNTITVEATGDIKLDAKQNIEIKATKDVKISGAKIEVQATGQMVVKGATVEIN